MGFDIFTFKSKLLKQQLIYLQGTGFKDQTFKSMLDKKIKEL